MESPKIDREPVLVRIRNQLKPAAKSFAALLFNPLNGGAGIMPTGKKYPRQERSERKGLSVKLEGVPAGRAKAGNSTTGRR